MNAKKKAPVSKSTALVPVEKRAIVALGLQHREKELATLAAATAHIVTITNDDGYKQVDSARKALKRERLATQKAGDEKIEDGKRVIKLADAELTRLVGIAKTEEDRLQTLQDSRDTEIEEQRQAAVAAEVARQANLQKRVAELHGCQMLLATSGSALIAEHIDDLEAIPVDESFEECREQAESAKAEGLTRLRALHASAVAHEAAQRKIAADLAELAERRAQDTKREVAPAEVSRTGHGIAISWQPAPPVTTEIFSYTSVAPQTDPQSEWEIPPNVPTLSAASASDVTDEASLQNITFESSIIPTREEILAAMSAYFGEDAATVQGWLSQIDWRTTRAEAA